MGQPEDALSADVAEEPTKEQTILLVDDEDDILSSLKTLFEISIPHIRVLASDSGVDALKILEKEEVDLIITDYRMPGLNGLDFLARAEQYASGVPRVLITAFPDLDIAMRAINEAGVENFITKPFNPEKVVDAVQNVLRRRRSQLLRDQSYARALDLLRDRFRSP